MPKFLYAKPPADLVEERKVRKLAGARRAPGDWILWARMIEASWRGLHTTAIAAELGCHPQTVCERLARFNAEGLDGLGDRPIPGRPPRLTEDGRSTVIALARSDPPGGPVPGPDGALEAADEAGPPEWTLDPLTAAARARGIEVHRSQLRRILPAEGGALAAPAFLGARHRPGVRPERARIVGLYTDSPPRSTVVCGERAGSGDPAHLCPHSGLVAGRAPDQGAPGVLPRAAEDLGLRGSTGVCGSVTARR